TDLQKVGFLLLGLTPEAKPISVRPTHRSNISERAAGEHVPFNLAATFPQILALGPLLLLP
ncbi:hypothetical protein, partial [Pseudomonas savastanoi]|uniref:hypothetical protein n=1 Tax=Pseudomonas savastanoi TaxID=29438 RepID=UPI001CC1DEAE